MSESLAAALVGQTLRDAMKGDTQAWVFLTHRSEMLDLALAHLGHDTNLFCATMESLQRSGDRQRMLAALRAFKQEEIQQMRRHRALLQKESTSCPSDMQSCPM